MTDLRNQRRMAASILKCGRNRVWMDSDRTDEIAKAVTRADVKILINGRAIKSKQIQGISRGRKKFNQKQKEKGRRKGHGSRKGAKYARLPRKERWMRTIRPIRTYLRQLRDDKSIEKSVYRKYYRKAKGGEFRSKHHLRTRLTSDGFLKEDKQ
ncbi:MAG: 50S ribosomal protein L19e [Candidatus Thermoplasmatota archaeon]